MNKLHMLSIEFNDAKLEFKLNFAKKQHLINTNKSFIGKVRNIYRQVINAFHGFR